MEDAAWLDEFMQRERLPATFRALIDSVHAPLARRIVAAAREAPGLLQVGICGAQGSGKSTLVGVLKALLEDQQLATAVLSLDDLYLTHEQRRQLGLLVHPLLATRGVPGTHDVALGCETLDSLILPGTVALPAFDKRSDDRLPYERWPRVNTPVRVVLFEGWCVGALPQADADLRQPVNTLEREEDADGRWRRFVNDQLSGPYRMLFERLDLLLLLQAPSFEVVFDWRSEQEDKLRERVRLAGEDLSRVMSQPQLRRFVSHYERITRNILAEMPERADVVLTLDAQRAPLSLRGA